jgi:hypothetical protein
MELYGVKLGTWETCVTTSPREVKFQQVIVNLNNASSKKELCDALLPVQGANYSDYVRPTSDTLAAGAHTLLQALMRTLPPK